MFCTMNLTQSDTNLDTSQQTEGILIDADQNHILVVDDDAEIVESLRYAISDRGYKVSIARDGNQALAVIETKHPNLVVLDMMMPKRSGFLVLERLCQTTSTPIPVIMITANEGVRHREYAMMLGVVDYIPKPFVMEQLLDSIDNILKTEKDD